MKLDKCVAIARRILAGFKVTHPVLEKRLAEHIQRTGRAPDIRIFWDHMKQDLDFEVLK